MSVIKDWKKYYTFEEAKVISDIKIEENSKKFSKKVLSKQKENLIFKQMEKLFVKENAYV